MDPQTTTFLLDLNRRFYADYGADFAATRRRIQPGARRVLAELPDLPTAAWLDIGCGSGSLAVEWLAAGRQSRYTGVDFSAELLAEARKEVAPLPNANQRVTFAQADLSDPLWAAGLAGPFTGALCFAVLHHLPSVELRQRVLRQVRGLLAPGAPFYLSVWQFQHSPKLMARRAPWETLGLDPAQLDPGDTLLDWRSRVGEPGGLRYVHLFTPAELAELAQSAGFAIRQAFESDGQGGRLGLYQQWIALDPAVRLQ